MDITPSDRFGKLTVLSLPKRKYFPSGKSHLQYEVECDCGSIKWISKGSLVSGDSRSCGCARDYKKWLTDKGYIELVLPIDHPFRGKMGKRKSNTVLEHRLVMAEFLGRPLEKHETVHHINGVRTDNKIENLQLRQGKHGNGIVMVCADCGSHNILATKIKEV